MGRRRGTAWWLFAAGAVAAAVWWILSGSATAWYWRVSPAAVWLAATAALAGRSSGDARTRRRSGTLSEAIVSTAPDAVIVVDERGTVIEWNHAAERLLGRTRASVAGAVLDPQMLRPAAAERAGDEPFWLKDGRHEAAASRADGETFPAEILVAPVAGGDTMLHALYVRDIRERRQAQRAAYDLAAIIESAADAVVSLTPDGVIESWNLGAERLYGRPAAEAIGQRISLVEPLGRPDDSRAVLALIRRGEAVTNLETVRVRKDGREVHVSLTVTPITDAAGAVIAAAEIGRDITARKQAERRVAYLAYHDDLTGLPNRLMFAEHLDLALARAQRHGYAVAVLYVDLDDFKHTNDTFGHEAGDELLRQVARRLERATRATDLVARHGGDEFLVLVADLPTDSSPAPREIARTIAEHVSQALAAPASLEGRRISAAGSVGVARNPPAPGTGAARRRRADPAPYRAKEAAGRVPSTGTAPGGAPVPLGARIQLALERGEFVLHYQPILRLDDLRMVGVEALIRWNHPDDGLLAPSAFIPLAERSDLITGISDWVMDEVCRVSRPWVLGEMNLQAAVNMPIARWPPDAADRLLRAIRAGGLDPGHIVVEVSESSAMTEPDRTQAILHDLHRRGIRLAIDDFGTGHSSLARLTEMPVSTLKIDRAFVRDIPANPHANAIAQTIIQLARNIGAQALAEGIETPEQCEFLKREGCALGQGFLFSPAVPADEVERLYRRFAREPAAP